jgi:hypothetical protein
MLKKQKMTKVKVGIEEHLETAWRSSDGLYSKVC